MPLDVAPPMAMMAGMGLALAVGSALLSEELFAEQMQRGATGWAAGSGGFG